VFGLLLGDVGLAGMSEPLTANVFNEPDRYLRVWFSTCPGRKISSAWGSASQPCITQKGYAS
jgi:hypothetical protein